MMKNFRQKFLFSISFILLIGLLVACGDSSSEEATAKDEANNNATDGELVVEIVAKGFQHDFWRAVKAGAEEAADDLGAKINFVGPKDESAIAEQVEMLNNAIQKGPDAIALAALDTDALIDLINQATNEGIPIVGFDSGVPDAPEGSIVANAATDNYAAGALAAEYLYTEIEDKVSSDEVKRIGVVAQEVNSLSITERTMGFIDTLEDLLESHEDIGEGNVAVIGHSKLQNDVDEKNGKVIIEARVPAELNDAAGQTEAQTLLNKEDLIAIYGSNEFAAKAIINADDALFGSVIGHDKVLAVGFDSGKMQIDAIKNERFFGSITQDPVSIGYESVRLAIDAANGEEVADVDTGAKWYDSSNVDDDDIQQLLYE